ncbi:MAG TPA: hypothetical protein VMV47_14725 [Bacteroidales bacterium]|nr:hypothetical protein [Bacteroidales bacterium]
MRISCFLISIFIFTIAYTQENPEKSGLKAGCNFSINTNGISSIPSFSLGAPAVIVAPTFTKGRLNYEPVLAYDMDIQPWFVDNWLRYKIVDRPKFEFRTGLNFSMYFSDYKLPDETILQGQRYWAAEFTAIYKPSARSFISGAYWNDRGQDMGTITGHYLALMAERSEIGIGKSFLLAVNLHLFYINYTASNDGLFISPKLTASLNKKPLALFFHGIQAISSNISPYPGFSWNLGLSYTI